LRCLLLTGLRAWLCLWHSPFYHHRQLFNAKDDDLAHLYPARKVSIVVNDDPQIICGAPHRSEHSACRELLLRFAPRCSIQLRARRPDNRQGSGTLLALCGGRSE
jgi:hypothetical protein